MDCSEQEAGVGRRSVGNTILYICSIRWQLTDSCIVVLGVSGAAAPFHVFHTHTHPASAKMHIVQARYKYKYAAFYRRVSERANCKHDSRRRRRRVVAMVWLIDTIFFFREGGCSVPFVHPKECSIKYHQDKKLRLFPTDRPTDHKPPDGYTAARKLKWMKRNEISLPYMGLWIKFVVVRSSFSRLTWSGQRRGFMTWMSNLFTKIIN